MTKKMIAVFGNGKVLTYTSDDRFATKIMLYANYVIEYKDIIKVRCYDDIKDIGIREYMNRELVHDIIREYAGYNEYIEDEDVSFIDENDNDIIKSKDKKYSGDGVSNALIDMVDGGDVYDIMNTTGLSMDRSKEIYDIYTWLTNNG